MNSITLLYPVKIFILFVILLGLARILIAVLFKKDKKSRRARTYARSYYDADDDDEVLGDGKTDIRELNYERKESIMTPTELMFYRNLMNVLGNKYWVFSKVNLWEVVKNVESRGWNFISRKHIDFVLSNPLDGKTILAIELDDPSHNAQRAKKNDKVKNIVLQKAGVPLLRIDVSVANDPRAIQRLVGNKLREVFRM